MVELARRPRRAGFSHVWTFDSHLLWQEPYVIYSRSSPRPARVTVGPMVTNPATRDWTVTASLFATLNEMYGNRTVCGIGRGDSAVRVTNGKPVDAGRAARGDPRDPRARRTGARSTTRAHAAVPVEPRAAGLEVWVAAYGPKALTLAGEVGDGFILQLADPDIAAWTIERGARARPRRPAATPTRSRSAWPRPRTSATTSAHMRDQCRWFGGMVGNHVADIVARYGADGAVSRRR